MKNIESIDHLIVQNEVNLDFHASFGISLNTFFFFLDYIFVIGTFNVVDFALIVEFNRYCCFICARTYSIQLIYFL
jgi:hypothetical protein